MEKNKNLNNIERNHITERHKDKNAVQGESRKEQKKNVKEIIKGKEKDENDISFIIYFIHILIFFFNMFSIIL